MAPQWVKEYCEKHELQKMFEEAANAVVKARAEEPAAFLVRRRSKKKYPLIPPSPEPVGLTGPRDGGQRRGMRGEETKFISERRTHAHASTRVLTFSFFSPFAPFLYLVRPTPR